MSRWTKIIEAVNASDDILIFTHMNMDGDAVASSAALCIALRKMGKNAFVLLEDNMPEYLSFLDSDPSCYIHEAPFRPQISIAVDCGADNRIEKRVDVFHSADKTICVDHHIKTEEFAEIDVVDSETPACAMLIYELLKEMCPELIDKAIASAIYVGISTDTGCFKFSNAKAEALIMAAELYNYGIDHVFLCNSIYGSFPMPQLQLESLAIDRAVIFCGGKAAYSWAVQEDVKKCNALPEMTETCIDRIRSIQGVEISAFIKQRDDGRYKVSMRAKSYANVNGIANAFGGGGHLKAAGFTFAGDIESLKSELKAAIEKELGC